MTTQGSFLCEVWWQSTLWIRKRSYLKQIVDWRWITDIIGSLKREVIICHFGKKTVVYNYKWISLCHGMLACKQIRCSLFITHPIIIWIGYSTVMWLSNSFTMEYSKTCLRRPLIKTPKTGFQDRSSLNAGLLTIKLPFVIKAFVLSIFEWPLKIGFTVLQRKYRKITMI